MKRGREAIKDIHKTEQCDEWLSTRNKHKIKPPSPKPRRRKSAVYKGFMRQCSSNLWHLTQSAPPHPLLLKATKQASIQGFFKPAANAVKSNSAENQHVHNSSIEKEFEGGDLEFDPQDFSTQKLNQNSSSPEAINFMAEKSCDSREKTFVDKCVVLESSDASVVERLSLVVDQCETKSADLNKDKLHNNQRFRKGTPVESCEVIDLCSSDNWTILGDLSLKHKRKTSKLNDFMINDVDQESRFSFTENDALDERSLKRSTDKLAISTDEFDTQSGYTVNNSLMFTQTETNKSNKEKTENIVNIPNDDTSDSFEDILKKVRERRRKSDDERTRGDIKARQGNESSHHEKVSIKDRSGKKASSKESENPESLKSGPFTLNTDLNDSENFEPYSKRLRRDSLHDTSRMKHTDRQTDSYLQTSEESSLQLSPSDTVSPHHLAQSGNSPTGKPHTQALKHRRPCWITRSAVNENVSRDKSAMKAKNENDKDFMNLMDRKSPKSNFFHDDSLYETTAMMPKSFNDKEFNVKNRSISIKRILHDDVDESIKDFRKGIKNNVVDNWSRNNHSELDFLSCDQNQITSKDNFSQVCYDNSLQFTPTQESQVRVKRGKKYMIEEDICL